MKFNSVKSGTGGTGGTLTYTDDQGNQQTKNLDSTVVVTLNGAGSNLNDLQDGDEISFSGDPVSRFTATR